MRVGIFGGAFNPPHIGHLICAQEALWQLELDRVVLMPVGDAPHRELRQDPGREARLELCRLAVAEDERLTVSTLEVDREGPSFTVTTLRALRALRDERPGDEPFLILGADQAAALSSWHEPEQVLNLASVAVAEREGAGREAVRAALVRLEGSERLRFFSMPRIDVSSSMVRERVAADRPIRYLVPPLVAERIEQEGLYREPVAGATVSRPD